MADLIKNPTQTELASIDKAPGIALDSYLGLMTNPDKILSTKGGGNYTLYQETLRDDQVKSTFQQRRLAVVSAPWEVDPGIENNRAAKKAADALRENLKAINFDAITDQMLFGIFYGHAVGEVMWNLNGSMVDIGSIKVRDRSRFRYGVDGSLYLQRKDFQFEQMPERKFWTFNTGADHGDNPYGLGLAHWLYWPVYFKRSDIKFWLVFLEKFGMPTVKGTLPAGQIDNQALRNKLLDALNSISTDSAIIVPEGAQVELIEAARSGSASYEEMQKTMDAAIAKIVLSQTMTTDNGSSRSQAEVHSGVKEEVVKADADMVCESLNRTVVKWWAEYNFPNAAQPRVWRRTEPEENLNTRAERDGKIYAMGYEPTEEYITETYGEGWVKKQVQDMTLDNVTNPDGSPINPSQDPNTDSQQFAESIKLALIKSGNRADHTTIVEAARKFASQYETVLGDRVDSLLSFADQSGDYETFRKHLVEMLGEQPSDKAAEKIRRANFVSRLVGALRAQR
jgi:phage gp29-like protein